MNLKYGEQAKKELNHILEVMALVRTNYDIGDYINLFQALEKTYSIFKSNHNREFIMNKEKGKFHYTYKVNKEDKEFMTNLETLLEKEVENLNINKEKTLEIGSANEYREWVSVYSKMLQLLSKVSIDNKESII